VALLDHVSSTAARTNQQHDVSLLRDAPEDTNEGIIRYHCKQVVAGESRVYLVLCLAKTALNSRSNKEYAGFLILDFIPAESDSSGIGSSGFEKHQFRWIHPL
jgi:hypothetical protein